MITSRKGKSSDMWNAFSVLIKSQFAIKDGNPIPITFNPSFIEFNPVQQSFLPVFGKSMHPWGTEASHLLARCCCSCISSSLSFFSHHVPPFASFLSLGCAGLGCL